MASLADLANPVWRLCNLYYIKSAATGQLIKFRPKPEQLIIFRAIHERGLKRIVVPKARRLGLSTAIDLLIADMTIFNAGYQSSIVDQTQDDASKKLQNIIKIAFDSLPDAIRKGITVTRSNDSTLEICTGNDTASAVHAGKNARGGTNQILHISEWGPIQHDDPRRSEEILTGALPSAEHGIVIVETTWKGGKGGLLYERIVKPALEQPESEKTERDWHVFFFPWWCEPSYSEAGSERTIDTETTKYLTELQQSIGQPLSEGQRVWYARRRQELGVFIWREFPSLLEECFRAPIDGAIYADIMDKLRAQGAIRPSPVDGMALIHTFWDLGSPINTVVWYAQFVGPEIRIIDVDADLDMTPTERVARMVAKGYHYGYHYLPHDAGATAKSGRTFTQELEGAGLPSISLRVIPRTVDVWIGINRLRSLMPRMSFRIPACDTGIASLENYHTRRETSSGNSQDLPVHDWSSHASDALRMLAEAEMAGMISGDSVTARQGKRTRLRSAIIGFGGVGGRRVRSLLDGL
jgi:hypothetical protein